MPPIETSGRFSRSSESWIACATPRSATYQATRSAATSSSRTTTIRVSKAFTGSSSGTRTAFATIAHDRRGPGRPLLDQPGPERVLEDVGDLGRRPERSAGPRDLDVTAGEARSVQLAVVDPQA